jgi:hypothetical protein
MQNNNFFSSRGDLVPMNPASLALSSGATLLAADKNTGRLVSKEALSDRCRALLAGTAMENTATLSAIEAYCRQVAPLGGQRYKLIADAYAAAAAARIARW